jgi:hypothetical protein
MLAGLAALVSQRPRCSGPPPAHASVALALKEWHVASRFIAMMNTADASLDVCAPQFAYTRGLNVRLRHTVVCRLAKSAGFALRDRNGQTLLMRYPLEPAMELY